MAGKGFEVEEVEPGEASPGSTLGRHQLDSVSRVREEMARVYRAVARGKRTPKEGAQMVYILGVIAKAIEVEKIEPLIEELERQRALANGKR